MKAQTQGSRPLGLAKAGAFQVLLWKEWRQQRWTLTGMTALGLGLFVLGGCLEKRWSFGLSGAALLLAVVGVPLVLSARAFAGEDEDGTAAFLRGLPFRPLQVFAAKFQVVVLASWAADSMLLVSGWLWSGYPDNAIGGLAWLPRAARLNPGQVAGIALWLVAPVAAAQAALLASLGLRSLTTALLSGACLCLCAYLGAVLGERDALVRQHLVCEVRSRATGQLQLHLCEHRERLHTRLRAPLGRRCAGVDAEGRNGGSPWPWPLRGPVAGGFRRRREGARDGLVRSRRDRSDSCAGERSPAG